MFDTVRSTWALLLGVAFIMLANGLQGTLLSLRATMESFPTTVIGLVMAGYFIGQVLGSLLAPRLVKRVGHIRVFGALASLSSIAILLHGVLIEPVVWFVIRVVTGFCYAGLYVVCESWLNDRATNETRGQLLGIYMIIVWGGLGSGQLLLNVSDPGGLGLFILTSAIVSFGLIPIMLTAWPAPVFEAAQTLRLRELLHISPLAVVGTTITGIGHGALFGMGAVYGRMTGLSVAGISGFMAAFTLGAALFQWPIGRLSDRVDRRKVIAGVAFAASALAAAGIWVPANHIPSLYLLACLLGGSALPMYSLCVSYANDRLSSEQMVAASAAMVLATGIGLSLGPILASLLMSTWGPNGFFLCIALAFASIVGFAAYRMVRQAPVAIANRIPYVAPGLIGSPVIEPAVAETLVEESMYTDPLTGTADSEFALGGQNEH